MACYLSQVMPDAPEPTIAAGIDDDRKLEELGYIPSFKREFSNLATVRPRFRWKLFVRNLKNTYRLALRSASWYSLHPVGQNPDPNKDTFQGLCSSVATTFNTPLLLGGPSSVCPETQ